MAWIPIHNLIDLCKMNMELFLQKPPYMPYSLQLANKKWHFLFSTFLCQ